MSIQPASILRRAAAMCSAAALSTLLAAGVLTGVASLFQRDGVPFEQAVFAERACAEYRYASEQDACMSAFAARATLRAAVTP